MKQEWCKVICSWVLAAGGMAVCAGAATAPLPAPSQLRVNHLRAGTDFVLTQRDVRFSWAVGSGMQRAYQILVASDPEALAAGRGDIWDSGKVESDASQNVRYAGPPLADRSPYAWRVRTWGDAGAVSPYTEAAVFRTGDLTGAYATDAPRLVQTPMAPVQVVRKAPGHVFADFGRAAFGTLALRVQNPASGQWLTTHLGEARSDPTTVHRDPGGTVRYRELRMPFRTGQTDYRLEIPAFVPLYDGHIPMPAYVGEVMPFRYVELVNAPDGFEPESLRQLATHVPFDDGAAHFASSDPVLNDVWELCKYSIKATTFAGIYVDGDRERKPYEADAYLNQLCHYAVDYDYATPRLSHEHLLQHPTWPTEWKLHSVFMAWADYLYTGDPRSLQEHYDVLQAKTLLDRARPDGLLNGSRDDIVDWPAGERDGYDMQPVKTVVSAVHYQALVYMADIARALGHEADAADYARRAERVRTAVNDKLWDAATRRYIDGMAEDGTPSQHASLHANLFPLAFGMVPADRRADVVAFLKSRGMACSVYPAQYLLEGLYLAGEDEYALSLMTDTGPRSWAHMLYTIGSTITLEAWGPEFKPNLDWNHAWGAAPANIIPRFVLGVRPLEPGFRRILIRPQPGTLSSAEGRVPTPRGPVHVAIRHNDASGFALEVQVPPNASARIGLPTLGSTNATLRVNGDPVEGAVDGDTVWLDSVGPGRHHIERGT
jgi:alpha-L-rhamnosidase